MNRSVPPQANASSAVAPDTQTAVTAAMAATAGSPAVASAPAALAVTAALAAPATAGEPDRQGGRPQAVASPVGKQQPNPEGFAIDGNFMLIEAAIRNLEFETVLDIGFGNGAASRFLAGNGKKVVAVDRDVKFRQAPLEELKNLGVEIVESSFEAFDTDRRFDAIWMSHVLEHTLDVGQFLNKARRLLSEKGWLLVCVPPWKHAVVGGHVTPGWNLGILMYALLITGFDIKNGHFIQHRYNVCGFVRKRASELPPLCHDEGDIERTRDFWPLEVRQAFDGNIPSVNWFAASK